MFLNESIEFWQTSLHVIKVHDGGPTHDAKQGSEERPHDAGRALQGEPLPGTSLAVRHTAAHLRLVFGAPGAEAWVSRL